MVLRDKAAIVTGAASGIGRAIARLFAREGAAVALVDRDAAGGGVEAEIRAAGGRALFVRADVTRDADCRAAVEAAVAAFGRLDIVCNNAGIIRRGSILETGEADWDATFLVNVKGVFLMSRHAVPVLERGGGGAVINTASNWGLVGGARAAAYSASKGAVVLLTRSMAIDHGPKNVRVNCLCPGDTDTPMLRSEAGQLGEPLERFLRESAESAPLRRLASPEEIAQGALYLASDAASFVNGAPLVIDGGFTAG
ncbi:MAG: SDR family NAD(P)-dependent oxidoreductase [Candidatus Polarisedimenticolia bacterium]